MPNGKYLLFDDIPKNTTFKWKEGQGISVYLKPSGYSGSAPFTGPEPGANGLTLDHQGRLLLCQHGDRRVVRQEKDGKLSVLADRYEGKRLNSPNDIVVKSNGDIYFTDPPYGLPEKDKDPARELDFQGVYRISQDAKLTPAYEGIEPAEWSSIFAGRKNLIRREFRRRESDRDGI